MWVIEDKDCNSSVTEPLNTRMSHMAQSTNWGLVIANSWYTNATNSIQSYNHETGHLVQYLTGSSTYKVATNKESNNVVLWKQWLSSSYNFTISCSPISYSMVLYQLQGLRNVNKMIKGYYKVKWKGWRRKQLWTISRYCHKRLVRIATKYL